MEQTIEFTTEDEDFRREVRDFLDQNLSHDWDKGGKPWTTPKERIEYLRAWQRKLNAAGLAAISWPVEYGGRGAGLAQQIIYNEEMSRRSVPDVLNRSSILQLGPALIQWASQEIKDYFLPKILDADILWCQGFSEPGAGSDLAGMTTKAVDMGDHFLVSGSKVWTSGAERADYCFLLAKTDTNVPKNQGITAFILDMKEPGITIRPLRQITGVAGFNQVFFDEVRVPRNRVIGEVNNGWQVATNTLRFERAGTATVRAERRLDILVKVAKDTKFDGQRRLDDPVVRDKLARYSTIVSALGEMGWSSIVKGLKGIPPGAETSIAKLIWSEVDQSMADFGMELLGPYGPLQAGSPHVVKGGNPATGYLLMRAATLGGGTSEIQRNIIGERLLGLPKEK
ncbi:acyl-CoA dehydrogenase family protein [Phenylobacterium sp.]|uniref:acyl-CoA dehydrogenase family protein n=1 Tax=Phenylobacterium sp. TaxID=1871053 RepID=UPI00301CAD2C